MIPTLARLFKAALQSRAPARKTASLKDLQTIRQALQHCVADCEGPRATRLRHQIEQTKTPQELWLLRNDAYQLIAQHHNQATAAERINALMAAFEGWLEPKQLIRIK